MITAPPQPVKDCPACDRLFVRWQAVSNPGRDYNPSAASDCVVLIRRHGEHGGNR